MAAMANMSLECHQHGPSNCSFEETEVAGSICVQVGLDHGQETEPKVTDGGSHHGQQRKRSKNVKCRPAAFQHWFREQFSKLGKLIHRSPAVFVLLPVFCTAYFGQYFLQGFDNQTDFKDLVLGKETKEKAVVEEYFGSGQNVQPNASDVNAAGCGVKPKNRRSLIIFAILRNQSDNAILEANFLELSRLEMRIKQNFHPEAECLGSCQGNQLIPSLKEKISSKAEMLKNEPSSYPWPGYLDEDQMKVVSFPGLVGKPRLSEDGKHLVSIAGVNFKYHFMFGDQKTGDDWEMSFMQNLTQIRQEFPKFQITANGELGWKTDEKQKLDGLKSRLTWSAVAVIVIAVATAWDTRWERNKTAPLLLALVYSAMAIVTTKGIMTLAGVPWNSFNYAVFFIMLGVGLDDTFVFLASWANSDCRKSTEARMGSVFSEAAVAVTLTSLTDSLSFWIGATAPFELSVIFCKYAGTGMLVLYMYQIILFGTTMSIFGRFEESRRHGLLLFIRVSSPVAKDAHNKQSLLQHSMSPVRAAQRRDRLAGRKVTSRTRLDGEPEYVTTRFLRDHWGRWVNMAPVQIAIGLIYALYLSGAVYYLHHLQVGIKPVELCFTDSELQKYLQAAEDNFAYLGARFQVVVVGHLNYSDPQVQNDMESLIARLESHPWIAEGEFTDSWLRNFKRYLQIRSNVTKSIELSIEDEETFVYELKEFMEAVDTTASKNVRFSTDGSNIIASRFFLQVMHVPTDQNANLILPAIRRTISEFPQYEIYAYDGLFPWYDHDLSLPDHTLRALGLACFTVLGLAMIFIPNISVAFFIVFTLASIQLGVAGYSVPMGGKLEVGMTIGLIMSIGFCVDFATHISFAYVTSSISSLPPSPAAATATREGQLQLQLQLSPTDVAAWKIRDALGKLGWPIIQSAVTSIAAVLPLCSTPAYLFRMLAWNMSCIMVFGLFHGLAVLPVLFSLSSKLGAKCSQMMLGVKAGTDDSEKRQRAGGCSSIEEEIPRDSSTQMGQSQTTDSFWASVSTCHSSEFDWSFDVWPFRGFH